MKGLIVKKVYLAACLLTAAGSAGCISKVTIIDAKPGHVHYVNPEGMHHNPVFSQAVVAHGHCKTVYVGGQNAVDATGNIVGKGDVGVQAEQVLKNIETVLAEVGATPEDVIKWNIYMLQGVDARAAHLVFHSKWGERENPPLVTVVYVAGLAHPDFLLEIEAVAIVPDP